MKLWYLVGIVALAGCELIPTNQPDGMLNGRWRGPTASFYSDDYGLNAWQTNNNGYTTRPVVPGFDGKFDVPGRWWYVDGGQRPPGDSSAHVRFTGSVNVHTGVVFLTITDVATGRRYLTERLVEDHSPIPPPPASPPPPAP